MNPAPLSPTADQLQQARDVLARISEAYSERIVGQDRLRTSLLIALIAGGHTALAPSHTWVSTAWRHNPDLSSWLSFDWPVFFSNASPDSPRDLSKFNK